MAAVNCSADVCVIDPSGLIVLRLHGMLMLAATLASASQVTFAAGSYTSVPSGFCSSAQFDS
jgi:hypothetical protein